MHAANQNSTIIVKAQSCRAQSIVRIQTKNKSIIIVIQEFCCSVATGAPGSADLLPHPLLLLTLSLLLRAGVLVNIILAHLGLVATAHPSLPEGSGSAPHHVPSTPSAWPAAGIGLLAGAEPTHHPIGSLHHVVFGLIVASVTRVQLATAREPVQGIASGTHFVVTIELLVTSSILRNQNLC